MGKSCYRIKKRYASRPRVQLQQLRSASDEIKPDIPNNSSFTIVGRGGIAQNHTDRLQSQVKWQDLRLPEEDDTVAGSHDAVNVNVEAEVTENEIRQAQGWVQLPDGTVVLTSYPVIPTPHGPLLQHPGCSTVSSERSITVEE